MLAHGFYYQQYQITAKMISSHSEIIRTVKYAASGYEARDTLWKLGNDCLDLALVK
jgi:hypothetical protein